MRNPLRDAGQLAVACLAVGVLAGCQGTDDPPITVPAPATAPSPAPQTTARPTIAPPTTSRKATAPAKAPATSHGRQATSGEEQMKDGCNHGQLPKADCDKFFAGIAQDGVHFNK